MNMTQNLVLVFSIATLFGMGLGVTMDDLAAPLRDKRAVARVLLANLVLAPALIWVLMQAASLVPSITIPVLNLTLSAPLTSVQTVALMLFALAPGNPLSTPLSKVANANAAFTTGLNSMLVLLAVVALPLELTVLSVSTPALNVTGEETLNMGQIASVLVALQLVPFALGFGARARYPAIAVLLRPFVNLVGNLMLVLLTVYLFAAGGAAALMDMLLTALIVVVGLLLIGYYLGGADARIARALALLMGVRNVSAVLAIAAFGQAGAAERAFAGFTIPTFSVLGMSFPGYTFPGFNFAAAESAEVIGALALVTFLTGLLVAALRAGEWGRGEEPAAAPAAAAANPELQPAPPT